MTQEQLLQLGILAVFIGFVVIIGSFLFAPNEKEQGGKSSFKFSVVGFLGFIPFGFGNDKKLMMLTLILATAAVAATMILFSRSLKP